MRAHSNRYEPFFTYNVVMHKLANVMELFFPSKGKGQKYSLILSAALNNSFTFHIYIRKEQYECILKMSGIVIWLLPEQKQLFIIWGTAQILKPFILFSSYTLIPVQTRASHRFICKTAYKDVYGILKNTFIMDCCFSNISKALRVLIVFLT